MPSRAAPTGHASLFAPCGAAASPGHLKSKTERLGKSVCRRLPARSAALSTTQRLPHHFPAGAEAVTFVVRPFSLDDTPQHLARLQRWGLTFGTSFSLFMLHSLNSYYKPVSSLQYLGGCRIRRLVRFLFEPFTRICAKIDAYSRIYDTTHLSYFRAVVSLFPQYGLTAFRRTAPGRLVALRVQVGAPAWTLEQVGLPSRVLPVKDVLCTTGDGRYSRKALRCQ